MLALRLSAAQWIAVGRLGSIEFPAGWYLYVGSARGPGGLVARVARHRRQMGSGKQAHWHIDMLRDRAAWAGVWARTGREHLECAWAAALRSLPGATGVAPGFGASDCRCPTHLVSVSALPSDAWFLTALGAERIAVGDDPLDELLAVLVSGDDDARETAALAIGRLATAEARQDVVASLAGLLAHDEADIRWWAARALGEIGESAVEPLLPALGDVDADVRACAALALGCIGAGAAGPGLAARLTDDSAFVAGIAADALAMIGPAAVESLLAVLAAEDASARLLAVRALARIKDPSAIGPVFELLDDPSYLVRYYADEALEAMGAGLIYVAP